MFQEVMLRCCCCCRVELYATNRMSFPCQTISSLSVMPSCHGMDTDKGGAQMSSMKSAKESLT